MNFEEQYISSPAIPGRIIDQSGSELLRGFGTAQNCTVPDERGLEFPYLERSLPNQGCVKRNMPDRRNLERGLPRTSLCRRVEAMFINRTAENRGRKWRNQRPR